MAKYVGKRVVPKHCGAWTKNKGYENYIVAIVSEQDITTMPFDSRISYKIGLSPFSYKRDYYDEG